MFELMDMNIYELIRGRSHYVAEERIRRYMYQLIKAMDHMHKAGIFHRYIAYHILQPSDYEDHCEGWETTASINLMIQTCSMLSVPVMYLSHLALLHELLQICVIDAWQKTARHALLIVTAIRCL